MTLVFVWDEVQHLQLWRVEQQPMIGIGQLSQAVSIAAFTVIASSNGKERSTDAIHFDVESKLE